MGSLSCLNVSGGDITISFDKQNMAEAIRAKRMITDMLRRGYALLIEIDGKFTRCLEFHEDIGEYIVADFAGTEHEDGPRPTIKPDVIQNEKETIDEPNQQTATTKNRRGRKSVKMESAKARAVAPSSGG